jgi:hypothetical protein
MYYIKLKSLYNWGVKLEEIEYTRSRREKGTHAWLRRAKQNKLGLVVTSTDGPASKSPLLFVYCFFSKRKEKYNKLCIGLEYIYANKYPVGV